MRGICPRRLGRIASRPATGFLSACCIAVMSADGVVAQTVASSRSPVAAGTVVDSYPLDYIGDGDWVESGMTIGYQQLTMRKAVLEFDLSDLKPGVVDSARLIGQIQPIDSNPPGTRQFNFSVNAGNGVVDVGDNNQSQSFSTGWFNNTAGAMSSYDQTITRQLRHYQLLGANYLRQVIQPGQSTQGFDQVSLSPGPKLELQLRPTTASTHVFYQTPVAAAAAHAQSGGPFSVSPGAARMEVMNWNYAPFEQGRGLLEFDLSSIPRGAHILWAKVDVYIDGLQGSTTRPPYGPNLQIAGYFGDGLAAIDDVLTGASWTGSTGEIRDVGVTSWDISPEFVENVLVARSHLGLRFQPGQQPEYRASILLGGARFEETAPHLAIAYEIPEPKTFWLLAVALIGCVRNRFKRPSSED